LANPAPATTAPRIRHPVALVILLSAAFLSLRFLSAVVSPALPRATAVLWVSSMLTLITYLAMIISLAALIASVRCRAVTMLILLVVFSAACVFTRWILTVYFKNPVIMNELDDLLNGLGDLLLVLAALLFGRLVAPLVSDRNLLVPVALVSSIVDFWGVYWGFVHFASKKAAKVVAHFSAVVPQAGPPVLGGPRLGSIGLGDFVFMAIFFAVVAKFRMAWRTTLWLSLLCLLIAAYAFIGLSALPGLPFLAAAVLLANWHHFSLSRTEKVLVIWSVVIISALLAIVTLISKIM